MKPNKLQKEALKEDALQSAIAKRGKVRNLSALQQRMQKKLDSGKFRMLNESMYTTTGDESRKLMSENPQLFDMYHAGYSEQVKRWPSNPLDDVIRFLSTQDPGLRIADLGCGEARLAKEIPQKHAKSFDLVAANDSVTECDIADVPLPDSSVDVVVFCLSLMGTNYADFIKEARRILVPNGLMLIAEVASRFEDQDPKSFVGGVESLGFKADSGHPLSRTSLAQQSTGNKKHRRSGGRKHKKKQKSSEIEDSLSSAVFFYKFAFRSTKSEIVESGVNKAVSSLPKLAACVYKKR